MLDIETFKRRGGDTTIPFAFFGQPLKFFGGRAHEAATVYSIQVFGRGLRKQAAIIEAHETKRRRYAVHDLLLEVLAVFQRQRAFHRQMDKNPIQLVSVVPQLLGMVSGPFCVEATIPTPVDWEGDGEEDSGDTAAVDAYADHVERMIEVLRRSPVSHLGGGQRATLSKVRRPARTMNLSAEALIEGDEQRTAAIVFGPENGAVAEKLVFEAAREAYAKGYGQLYVVGFAVQPDARRLIENCERTVGVPATYIQASMDLLMGDLLKNLRSSQIFSVCGLPDVRIERTVDQDYRVELLGLDVFDPVEMDSDHRDGDDVPAWFLDTNYNGLCFHVCQAFFPRTSAWEGLKCQWRSKKGPPRRCKKGPLGGCGLVP